MPTYPYACTECGHQFETRQSFSDDPLTVCRECNGRLRKVWGSVGVVFKGSGFYRTDSRSDGKSTGDSAKGSSGSSEKTGESKSSGDTKSGESKKSDSSSSKAGASSSSSS